MSMPGAGAAAVAEGLGVETTGAGLNEAIALGDVVGIGDEEGTGLALATGVAEGLGAAGATMLLFRRVEQRTIAPPPLPEPLH